MTWKKLLVEDDIAKNNLSASVAPTANEDSDDGYSVGSVWIDTTADKAYACLDASVGAAVWTETTQSGGGGGSQDVPLLDGSEHNDTVAQAPTRGSLIYANATPKWDELTKGTAGKVLRMGANDPAWSTIKITHIMQWQSPTQTIDVNDIFLPTDACFGESGEHGTLALVRFKITADPTNATGNSTFKLYFDNVSDFSGSEVEMASVTLGSAAKEGDDTSFTAWTGTDIFAKVKVTADGLHEDVKAKLFYTEVPWV